MDMGEDVYMIAYKANKYHGKKTIVWSLVIDSSVFIPENSFEELNNLVTINEGNTV
ncbi:MAG: hypothetical protein ACTSRP_16765 [Candidatus Helarchaeota archaeon]